VRQSSWSMLGQDLRCAPAGAIGVPSYEFSEPQPEAAPFPSLTGSKPGTEVGVSANQGLHLGDEYKVTFG
jgi:hypothetical protein